jgi:DNA (cytosine-5)-methyltransferase 1
MSRNRVRSWDEQSFTILATDRHIPFHPQAPKMIQLGPNLKGFAPGHEDQYRRLTVRECARIQTFPDDYEFLYSHMRHGYKMIGNAVPVKFAAALANQILRDISKFKKSRRDEFVRGSVVAGGRKKRRRYQIKPHEIAL